MATNREPEGQTSY
ncbi:hypothetical protein LINGRAHAP2_LOCUS13419 [Linum grandiflorum]